MKFTEYGPGDPATWGGVIRGEGDPREPKEYECPLCLNGWRLLCLGCESVVEVEDGDCPICGNNDFEPCDECGVGS